MKKMLSQFLCSVFGLIFPERTKRLIVMSSLLGRLFDRKKLDPATLQKLNETLHICEFQSAMLLPLRYSHTIWNNEIIDINSNCEKYDSTSKFSFFTKELVDSVPDWLKYNKDDMEKDVSQVLLYYPVCSVNPGNDK